MTRIDVFDIANTITQNVLANRRRTGREGTINDGYHNESGFLN